MASRGITTVLRTDRLVKLIGQLPAKSQSEVDTTSTAIQDRASQLAPRDTGSLRASIYVSSTGGQTDYPDRAASAKGLNRVAVIVPEVTPEFALSLFGGSSNGYTSIVGSAVEHALFQELGTRYMGPQPFFTPAVEAFRDQFVEGMKTVADV